MRIFASLKQAFGGAIWAWVIMLGPCLIAQPARGDSASDELVNLANDARVAAGLDPLQWDQALTAAAAEHAHRMAADSSISHRYQGEPDLAERTSAAGARFSLIEENVAVASTAMQIHNGWMNSKGHRENLLNPAIDRIGVAVVSAHGLLFAVADYSRFTPSLTHAQIEFTLGRLLSLRGLDLVHDPSAARQYCASAGGLAGYRDILTGEAARFGMRWQAADLSMLPRVLEDRIASGKFQRAAVGGCSPHQAGSDSTPAFAAYRVGVILY